MRRRARSRESPPSYTLSRSCPIIACRSVKPNMSSAAGLASSTRACACSTSGVGKRVEQLAVARLGGQHGALARLHVAGDVAAHAPIALERRLRRSRGSPLTEEVAHLPGRRRSHCSGRSAEGLVRLEVGAVQRPASSSSRPKSGISHGARPMALARPIGPMRAALLLEGHQPELLVDFPVPVGGDASRPRKRCSRSSAELTSAAPRATSAARRPGRRRSAKTWTAPAARRFCVAIGASGRAATGGAAQGQPQHGRGAQPATTRPRRRPATAQHHAGHAGRRSRCPARRCPSRAASPPAVMTAMATMATSATMSSMRVTPARIDVAASAPSAAKASTRRPARHAGRVRRHEHEHSATPSASAAAAPKNWRAMMWRTARCGFGVVDAWQGVMRADARAS